MVFIERLLEALQTKRRMTSSCVTFALTNNIFSSLVSAQPQALFRAIKTLFSLERGRLPKAYGTPSQPYLRQSFAFSRASFSAINPRISRLTCL